MKLRQRTPSTGGGPKCWKRGFTREVGFAGRERAHKPHRRHSDTGAQRMRSDCWLVNTGWTGGAYGTGKRMSIQHTRALLAAVLDGSLKDARFERDPFFGLMFPQDVKGIPNEVLNPRLAWVDKGSYDKAAADLVARFETNFASFNSMVDDSVRAVAIKAVA